MRPTIRSCACIETFFFSPPFFAFFFCRMFSLFLLLLLRVSRFSIANVSILIANLEEHQEARGQEGGSQQIAQCCQRRYRELRQKQKQKRFFKNEKKKISEQTTNSTMIPTQNNITAGTIATETTTPSLAQPQLRRPRSLHLQSQPPRTTL